MATVLQFHPYRGARVPKYPNVDHDEARVAKEAGLRGQTKAQYIQDVLAFTWPNGKPAFTQKGETAKADKPEKDKADDEPPQRRATRRTG
jgi:hypothetical protein